MGCDVIKENIFVFNYGKEYEFIVKEKYVVLMNCNYKEFIVIESGLFVDLVRLYFGVFLDLFVYCICCGVGLLEIKCFFLIVDEIFLVVNLLYFVECDNIIILKKDYVYYV